MIDSTLTGNDVIGLVRPSIDAHTLGIDYLASLLKDCNYQVVIASRDVTEAVNQIRVPENKAAFITWIRKARITRLGLSFRLSPRDAFAVFARIHDILIQERLYDPKDGPVRSLYFGGLPESCDRIASHFGRKIPVFRGDETPIRTLEMMGVPAIRIPKQIVQQGEYERILEDFAFHVQSKALSVGESLVARFSYPGFGTDRDHVFDRIDAAKDRIGLPLMRAHAGPFMPDRAEAIKRFVHWAGTLAKNGTLDVLSIGTSQLTQESFGQNWGDRPNGGGVPVNSSEEYASIREAARPMLVRTYSGTNNIPALAEIHEKSLHNAWHALSFWWFCRTDGRGPLSVDENLRQHFRVLDIASKSRTPVEPNVPHHFSFRGGDDLTYVLSGVLAARAIKKAGVKYLIIQNMLNTPKYTSGVCDIVKSRALFQLTKELESRSFRVAFETRAGLDFFSPNLEKAKNQLSAVSAMMADICPTSINVPEIVHVVSYPEAQHHANPMEIIESIGITRRAITNYRGSDWQSDAAIVLRDSGVELRTRQLVHDCRQLLKAIEQSVKNPYTAMGFYEIFCRGFLAAPALWGDREAFPAVVRRRSRVRNGSVELVDDLEMPLSLQARIGDTVQQ